MTGCAAADLWGIAAQALTLLDHLVKNGNERIVEEARDHMHKIRTLTDFNHYEGHVDRGAGSKSSAEHCCRVFVAHWLNALLCVCARLPPVREKAKALLELLSSNEAIRSEREKARNLRDKFVGIGSTSSGFGGYGAQSYGGSSGPSYSGRYG